MRTFRPDPAEVAWQRRRVVVMCAEAYLKDGEKTTPPGLPAFVSDELVPQGLWRNVVRYL